MLLDGLRDIGIGSPAVGGWAVLGELLEVLRAEQLAPEQVRYHFLSRHLVQTWVRTQKGKPSHQLKGLADRLRVA